MTEREKQQFLRTCTRDGTLISAIVPIPTSLRTAFLKELEEEGATALATDFQRHWATKRHGEG